ncbi:hypothetical protein E4T56_gene3014 [Termitomyces sp. T112]|nr:hypothetical protein E4T56_gene3014 [Termitomyces sp. T112]
MAFALDTLSAHLSSHSSHTLLLHTTLAFSANSIPTLCSLHKTSGTSPILLKLFDSNPTSTRDITHSVLPALVNSGASSTFVSNQLDLSYDTLDKPLELQLFNGSPALTGVIQYHDSTLTLDNRLKFQVQLLITQLLESTLIVLGLPWLQDINPNIDWKDLSTQFLGPKASLTAAIPLCLQPPSNSNIPDLDSSSSRMQLTLLAIESQLAAMEEEYSVAAAWIAPQHSNTTVAKCS